MRLKSDEWLQMNVYYPAELGSFQLDPLCSARRMLVVWEVDIVVRTPTLIPGLSRSYQLAL